jgi:putative ABC transport system permease protein
MKNGISRLDFKLGARRVVKYPGLTLVAGLGMAVAIAVGAGSFSILNTILDPKLPLDEGERVVGLENWNVAANRPEPHALHDFAAWREELRSVEDLGAFRTIERNLIIPGGRAEPVPVAEITASGFEVARVPPLLGRPLVEADQREGAPAVVVIGYDAWQRRFGADPAVVGRTVHLGNTVHTIVGVMPEGFAFPVNHGFWTPLRASPLDYARGQGPEITMFGRLAPGATLDGAQAELAAVGKRTSAAFPETHERLRPRVVPYAALFFNQFSRWEIRLVQLLVTMLLVVVCVNVAILMYARIATRQGEIAVRTALGASRRRVVAQLFVEALVLAAGAAVVGLVLVRLASGRAGAVMGQIARGVPFWANYGLSLSMFLYVAGFTLFAAVIVGVLPALKATGRELESRLRQMGGGTEMQLGRLWTVLIVAQVAFAVAVLPAAVFSAWESVRYGMSEPGFVAEQYLSARLPMDRETPPTAEAEAYRSEFATRYANLQAELARRLEAEPAVSAVTFTSSVPGQEPTAFVEIDGVPAAETAPGHEVAFLQVEADFFDAFGAPVLTGRAFHSGDLGSEGTAVIVNRAFVRQFLGGGTALGRRVRYATADDDGDAPAEIGRWYEIVGVVADLPANPIVPRTPAARLYHPLSPGQIHPVTLALRMRGSTPEAVAARFREIATGLDPTLRLNEIVPLEEVYQRQRVGMNTAALVLGLVTLSVLLLSAAGVYALMSFTVARRQREIGIRAALGAHPHRILGSIFSRALGQLTLGVAVGIGVAALLEGLTGNELMDGKGAVILPAVSVFMLLVGLLAAVGPARRGLRIQPTEALREG